MTNANWLYRDPTAASCITSLLATLLAVVLQLAVSVGYKRGIGNFYIILSSFSSLHLRNASLVFDLYKHVDPG